MNNFVINQKEVETSQETIESLGVLHISSGFGGSSVEWKETQDLQDVMLYVISKIQNFYENAKGTPFELKEGVENKRVFHSFTENSFIVEWDEEYDDFRRTLTYNHSFIANFPKSEANKLLSWKFEKKHEYWDLHGFGSDTLFRLSTMLQVEYNKN